MAKIISFFNNKGGVGKTTSCYNTAWALSTNFKKKVLMIDFDPQCNLTGFFLGADSNKEESDLLLEKQLDYEDIYDGDYGTVYKLVSDIFNVGSSNHKTIKKNENKNLDILAGDVRLSSLESDISLAVLTKSPALFSLPTSFYRKIKEYYSDYDYIFLDMSPNLGILNFCIFMSSDYFIFPTFPDYFSLQVTQTIGDVLRTWNQLIDPFRKSKMIHSEYYFDNSNPKFLGLITQNFRIRKQNPAQGFAKWQNKINESVQENVVKKITNINMSITKDEFSQLFPDSEPYIIAEVSDYNTLSTIAQTEGLPVIALNENILKKHVQGNPLNQSIISIDRHLKSFNTIAKGITNL